MINAKRIIELLRYDEHTGEFHWLNTRSPIAKAGSRAGTKDSGGYRIILVDGRAYKAHRLAWLYFYGEWPEKHIDHINGDRADNRIINLRQADRYQNNSNVRLSIRNTSGLKGAHLFKGKWKAQINSRGKKIYLGTFSTKKEAHAAYCAAAKKLHGEFARPA